MGGAAHPGTGQPGAGGPHHGGGVRALYETTADRVARAARLRAEAGALRDADAAQPDWETIRRLLQDSYRDLLASLSTENAD